MALELQAVTKRFGSYTAVDQLSLSIPKGEIFGFLGANGAGKTTSFRMVLGLLEPNAGEITWNGRKIDYTTSDYIGYLPEERGLYPKLKVAEQVAYLAQLRGMKKVDALGELKAWLDFFKVPEYYDKKVEDLSKGNQQKIQFIASVIHRPELLILDEPFSGLDPVNAEMLKQAIDKIKLQGTTIVFSNHQMATVEELCENICILVKGKAVVYGALKDIKRSFGKKNIVVHADFDLGFLSDLPEVLKVTTTAEGVVVQIAKEADAVTVQEKVMAKGFVRKFALEEPTLQDIFIEKVGAKYE